MANPFGGADGQEGVDAMFVVICAFIVFTMQSGFGLLESGMVSARSEANVMIKNMIDMSLGGAAYWFVGFGFSFGPNNKASKAMSGEGLFITDVDINGDEAYIYVQYFFQMSFAATATTIVSGAVAERVKLDSYMIFAVINTCLIYVFPCHWVWAEGGWLYGKASDFAGSGVVHMAGGSAALAGAILLGPRNGRYSQLNPRNFAMACPTNVVLGTFFLWWGWIGFNCGSQFAISGDNWKAVGRVAVVTMNGGMGGGLAALIANLALWRWRQYMLDVGEFTAGILAGLVGITAGANLIRPWEALVIGAIGAWVALAIIRLLNVFKIDDPVGCFGVHWGSGLWAMIATGFFANTDDPKTSGVFRKGTGELLGWNLLAAVVITVWCFGCAFIVLKVLDKLIDIRMDMEHELKGSDEVEHGITNTEFGPAGGDNHTMGKRVLPNLFGEQVDAEGRKMSLADNLDKVFEKKASVKKAHDNQVATEEGEEV